jgi:hypothetical protein
MVPSSVTSEDCEISTTTPPSSRSRESTRRRRWNSTSGSASLTSPRFPPPGARTGRNSGLTGDACAEATGTMALSGASLRETYLPRASGDASASCFTPLACERRLGEYCRLGYCSIYRQGDVVWSGLQEGQGVHVSNRPRLVLVLSLLGSFKGAARGCGGWRSSKNKNFVKEIYL